MPVDGTYPTGTAKWEKRNLTQEIPVWDEALCIQCGKCVVVCPHSVIRAKVVEPGQLAAAPPALKHTPARWKGREHLRYLLQVTPEDCTGCALCVQVCPAKNKAEPRKKAVNLAPQAPIREQENRNWDFFENLPEFDRSALSHHNVKDVQLLQPLFEFPGACAGCGETPYIKLLTQLFGDRSVIANATGCSSIYSGNLPTTPYTKNRDGRGPAWSNSLFEDNAEFGLGMRVSIDKQAEYARELVFHHASAIGPDPVRDILEADQSTEAGISAQRERVERLKALGIPDLLPVAQSLVRKSVWIVGGDGWAYDIGYGGLDHVFASGRNVNILVLDTEVYSNTGGQMSKSTPRAAVAKFAAGGKKTAKKDLAMMAMTYGSVYVAHVAMGANDTQTVKSFLEAEAYDGPSLIIAYSHCIAHGYDMLYGIEQQKAAVQSAYWPLFRYHPSNGFQLDSRPPALPLEKYIYNEGRYTMLKKSNPEVAEKLLKDAQADVDARWALYENLAKPGSLKPR
jgi:pyruvate-ferredoxin/flavodoxin oxidoreductase